MPKPGLVRIVDEDERAAPDEIDHAVRHFAPQGRAAPAAAETSVGLDEIAADVRRAVDHDGALARQIVDPLLEAPQTQRLAVAPLVALLGQEEPEARLLAAGTVRKGRG